MSKEKHPLEDVFADYKKRYEGMDKEKLVDRLAFYEWALDQISPNVRWVILNLGNMVWVKWRMGREFIGNLMGAEFKIDQLQLVGLETIHKYAEKKVVYERRIVNAPLRDLVGFDLVLGKEKEEPLEY